MLRLSGVGCPQDGGGTALARRVSKRLELSEIKCRYKCFNLARCAGGGLQVLDVEDAG